MTSLPICLQPERLSGHLRELSDPSPVDGATGYAATEPGDGLVYRFEPGLLVGETWLTFDFLLDGVHLVVWRLTLAEGAEGRRFTYEFSGLNQAQGRFRMPISVVRQNAWMLPREGAFLKPRCGGDVVEPAKVDRILLEVLRKAEGEIRWHQTPLTVQAEEPELLDDPLLPAGPLLDELGQSTLHDWAGRTRHPEELIGRLRAQRADAPQQAWPVRWSRWGGCGNLRFEASGFFRTHHDGRRWWLVDPDGFAFWSAGLDCVRFSIQTACRGLETALTWLPPRDGEYAAARTGDRTPRGPAVNYLASNFLRAFSSEAREAWGEIVLSLLRRFGFNTVANWSDWSIPRAAGFPYVRPLQVSFPNTPKVFRDFPDVFDPAFESDAAAYAEQLRETAGDPAMIGYFLMNEPTWGFARQLPAEGMLVNTPSCRTRQALAAWLREKCADEAALTERWGRDVTFDRVAEGRWSGAIGAGGRADLEAFSTVMVEKLFSTLSRACRAVDPDHLNLGARYHTVPPRWAFEGMGSFDVFSVNGYGERVRDALGPYSEEVARPVMIGEWHHGALDVGLPASGIGHVRTQVDRGRAYRAYLEDAAARSWCVGVHYFTLYDQSALGRYDGENYNIGFVDVCHRPYEPLAEAARASHERLYAVARGEAAPFDDPPEYLPMLFS